MADVSELITLGVGTPSSIPFLIRFGLGQGTTPIVVSTILARAFGGDDQGVFSRKRGGDDGGLILSHGGDDAGAIARRRGADDSAG